MADVRIDPPVTANLRTLEPQISSSFLNPPLYFHRMTTIINIGTFSLTLTLFSQNHMELFSKFDMTRIHMIRILR